MIPQLTAFSPSQVSHARWLFFLGFIFPPLWLINVVIHAELCFKSEEFLPVHIMIAKNTQNSATIDKIETVRFYIVLSTLFSFLSIIALITWFFLFQTSNPDQFIHNLSILSSPLPNPFAD